MKIALKIVSIILLTALLETAVIIYFLYYLPVYKYHTYPSLLALTVPLIIAALLLGTVTYLTIYFLVIKPIVYLKEIAQMIALGNLSRKTEIARVTQKDEIGELAQSIDAIIVNLARGLQQFADSLRDEKFREKLLSSNLSELEIQKARDDALLTSIGDGVIAIDLNHKIILFNKTASKLTGFSTVEALFQPYPEILIFLDEKSKTIATDFIKPVFQGQKTFDLDHIILQNKQGNFIPVSPTVTPIIDNKNQTLGVIIALRDVTKDRELNHMKDEFVSVASHELRTPMTAIKGLISMIFEGDYGPITEGIKDPLNDIAVSTNRLISMVNDILDVSRIEAGRVKISLSNINIHDIITEIAASVKPLIDQKHLQLVIQGASNLIVQTDPGKAKEIINNLLGNAIKFTDQGQIIISVRPDNDKVSVEVTDTGLGIAQSDQIRLFTKFLQITSTQIGRPIGTGLGLYISKEFAKKMGGDVILSKSALGKGSTFTFLLPIANSALAKELLEKVEKENPK